MINLAIYQKQDSQQLLRIDCNGKIKYFSDGNRKDCIKLISSNKNKLQQIISEFGKEPFLLILSDEKIVSDLPDDLNCSHVCLAVNDFFVKSPRVFNTNNHKVNKLILKSNEFNIFPFDQNWIKESDTHDRIAVFTKFLFGKKMSEDLLYVYFQILKDWLKKNTNLKESQEWLNTLLKTYPQFIELSVLTASYFYEQNNHYKALSFLDIASKLVSKRNIYDLYPMCPKYHKTILNEMRNNILYLIKKFDQVH
jgi:hypothetical protein